MRPARRTLHALIASLFCGAAPAFADSGGSSPAPDHAIFDNTRGADVLASALSAKFRLVTRISVGELLSRVASASLLDGKAFVLAPDGGAVATTATGEIVLAPGRTVELADIRWPHIRVQLTAPRDRTLNLSRLVEQSGQIFAGVAANSKITSQLGSVEATLIAALPAPDASDLLHAVVRVERASGGFRLFRAAAFLVPESGMTAVAVAVNSTEASAVVESAPAAVAGIEARPIAPPQVRGDSAAGDGPAAGTPVVVVLAATETAAAIPVVETNIEVAASVVEAKVEVAAPADETKSGVAAVAIDAAAPARIEAQAPASIDVAASAELAPEPVVLALARVELPAPAAPVAEARPEAKWMAVAAPQPVKLERIERHMPMFIFDRRGGFTQL